MKIVERCEKFETFCQKINNNNMNKNQNEIIETLNLF